LFWPVKKIAAAVAMAGATAYCVFSGAEVATQRSLVMTLVMLGAILADRPALSMRNLAIAAILVLAREPEALLGPSFQMSFGAVAALIALAAHLAGRPGDDLAARGLAGRALARLKAGVTGLLATTLVASLATGPFGAYHFQTANPFGLVGNALTLPLVSFVVMPGAVLGVLAAPFGLDGPVWQVIGLAVAQVLAAAEWVSGFPGSALVVPAFATAAVLLFGLALVVATLPVSPLRLAALAPGLAALWIAATPARFDLHVDREGAGAAVRAGEGRLAVLGRPSGFVVEQWLRADGDAREAADPSLRRDARCDGLGCVARGPGGAAVAYVAERRAFPEDCARAAVVVSRWRAPRDCTAPLVLDRAFLEAEGAAAVRFRPEGPRVVTVRSPAGLDPEEARRIRLDAAPARAGEPAGAGAPRTLAGASRPWRRGVAGPGSPASRGPGSAPETTGPPPEEAEPGEPDQ
jgi:competence protein ComEC